MSCYYSSCAPSYYSCYRPYSYYSCYRPSYCHYTPTYTPEVTTTTTYHSPVRHETTYCSPVRSSTVIHSSPVRTSTVYHSPVRTSTVVTSSPVRTSTVYHSPSYAYHSYSSPAWRATCNWRDSCSPVEEVVEEEYLTPSRKRTVTKNYHHGSTRVTYTSP